MAVCVLGAKPTTDDFEVTTAFPLIRLSALAHIPAKTTMATLYDRLGVKPSATPDQLKVAWRRAARRWHPDRNPGNQEEATKRFQDIGFAYAILGDPHQRARYDETLRQETDGRATSQPRGTASRRQTQAAGQATASAHRETTKRNDARSNRDVFQTYRKQFEIAQAMAQAGSGNEEIIRALVTRHYCPPQLARRLAEKAIEIHGPKQEATHEQPKTNEQDKETGQGPERAEATKPERPRMPYTPGLLDVLRYVAAWMGYRGFSASGAVKTISLVAFAVGVLWLFKTASVATRPPAPIVARISIPAPATVSPQPRTLGAVVMSQISRIVPDFDVGAGRGTYVFERMPTGKAFRGFPNEAKRRVSVTLLGAQDLRNGPTTTTVFFFAVTPRQGAYDCTSCKPFIAASILRWSDQGDVPAKILVPLTLLMPLGSGGKYDFDAHPPQVETVGPGEQQLVLIDSIVGANREQITRQYVFDVANGKITPTD